MNIAILFGIYHLTEKEELIGARVERTKITKTLEPSPLKEVLEIFLN